MKKFKNSKNTKKFKKVKKFKKIKKDLKKPKTLHVHRKYPHFLGVVDGQRLKRTASWVYKLCFNRVFNIYLSV